MTEAVAIVDSISIEDESGEASVSAVSWAAIVAGGLATATLTLFLLAFGTGMGFSVVSPWSNSGVSGSTLILGAGFYLIVVAMISSSIGGYLAGRLRIKWVGVHTNEVYFRDTAHGFLAWAFATALSAAVLGTAATSIIHGASTGLASGANAAASPLDPYRDRLLRSNPSVARTPSDPAASRAELGRLLSSAVISSELSASDRTYMDQLVAARTGLSQADAEKRVSDVIMEAKTAADEARKTAEKLSLWLAASLLIGAFSASLAAIEGGGVRDGTWKYQVAARR
jgi:hypothetical protein